MSMRRYIKIVGLLGFLVCSACEQETAEPGTLNGPCKLEEIQCDDALICREGRCQPPVGEALPTLDIAIELLKREVIADGEDSFDFQLLVNVADTNQPFNGSLLMVTEPSGVGRLSPGLVDIQDGFGVGTYQACNRRADFPCPEVMSLKIAHPNAPLELIFESETFRQLSPDITASSSIQMGNCRGSIGSRIGVLVPNQTGEKLSSDTNDPISEPTASTFTVSSDSINLEFPLPDQRTDQYQALSPNQVSVTILQEAPSNEAGSDMPPAVSSCLADGVWIGSQRLEFWDEESEDGSTIGHVMSNLAIDCYDEQGGYAVIRVCAHGTL